MKKYIYIMNFVLIFTILFVAGCNQDTNIGKDEGEVEYMKETESWPSDLE